jgi:hypothetical protein
MGSSASVNSKIILESASLLAYNLTVFRVEGEPRQAKEEKMGFVILFLNTIGGILDFLFFGEEALIPMPRRRLPMFPIL